MKLNILTLLIMSALLNVILLMKIIPVDSTVIGSCSIGEKHLSLLGGDYRIWQDLKKRADEVRKNNVAPKLPLGIDEGARACDGRAYVLYIW
jgi:hypothetical protein